MANKAKKKHLLTKPVPRYPHVHLQTVTTLSVHKKIILAIITKTTRCFCCSFERGVKFVPCKLTVEWYSPAAHPEVTMDCFSSMESKS